MNKQKNQNAARSTNQSLLIGVIVIGLIAAVLAVPDSPLMQFIPGLSGFSHSGKYAPGSHAGVCQQPSKLSPKNTEVEKFIHDKVESEDYHEEIIDKLTGIIQIPSESYDELGPIGIDARWNIFYKMEDYIKSKYPTILKNARLDHANTHGLILTWEGSVPPSEAKPILMLAHQDVVPAFRIM